MSAPGAPLVSLCMIVKDEVDELERSLASAGAVADELVVYDTGSTDGTQDLARSLGATVVQGTWSGDFGRARNEALRHCHGTWILWLDADEELEADPRALRAHLAGLRRVDALQVEILNVGAASGEFTHIAERVFRRSRMRWQGSLHEVLVRRDGAAPSLARLDGARVLHHGYDAEHVVDRGKIERNLEIALAALEGPAEGAELGRRHVNAARSLALAGRRAEAIPHYDTAIGLLDGQERRFALHRAAEELVELGRLDEARERNRRFVDEGGSARVAAWVDGLAALRSGDGAPLAGFDPELPVTDGSQTTTVDRVRLAVAEARGLVEDWAGAADLLERVVDGDPSSTRWADLVGSRLRAGATASEALADLSDDDLRRVVPQLISLPTDDRHGIALALLERLGERSPVAVAFVAGHAAHLDDIEDVLPWAQLVRASGFDVPCPIMARARDIAQEPTRRFLAAATAHAAFRDPEALQELFAISDLLRPEEEADAAFILSEIAPDLIVS